VDTAHPYEKTLSLATEEIFIQLLYKYSTQCAKYAPLQSCVMTRSQAVGLYFCSSAAQNIIYCFGER